MKEILAVMFEIGFFQYQLQNSKQIECQTYLLIYCVEQSPS